MKPGTEKDSNKTDARASDKKKKTQAAEQPASWQYKTDDPESPQDAPQTSYVQPVSWTASEYIAHQKNAGWFMLVMLVIIAVATGVYFWTKDLISPIVIVVIGLAFTVFAARPPQTMEYSLDGTGINIGPKTYPYERFRSFSVLTDEPIPTILFIPLRRFDLPLAIHFEAADTDKIIGMLGNYLPGEERNAPPVDRLMSKIRF